MRTRNGRIDQKDNHNQEPVFNESSIAFQETIIELLGFKVRVYPWIDLIQISYQDFYLTSLKRLKSAFLVERYWPSVKGWKAYRLKESTRGQILTVMCKWIQLRDGRYTNTVVIRFYDNPTIDFQESVVSLIADKKWTLSRLDFSSDIVPIDNNSTTILYDMGRDFLTRAAWASHRRGMAPALVSVQDVVERFVHQRYARIDSIGRFGSTSYRGKKGKARAGAKGMRNYIGPSHVDPKQREFMRPEVQLNRNAIRSCIESGRGGVSFPVRIENIDFGHFIEIVRPKDIQRIVDAALPRLVDEDGDFQEVGIERRMVSGEIRDAGLTGAHPELRDYLTKAKLRTRDYFERLYPPAGVDLARYLDAG